MDDINDNTQELFEILEPDNDLQDNGPYEIYNIQPQDIDLNRIKELLANGVDINARDSDGNTFLIRVLTNYNITNVKAYDIVKQLLKAGANVNIPKSVVHHPTFDENNDLPIQISISIENLQMTELLIDNGADVNMSLTNNTTPFQLAIAMPEMTRQIIQKMIDNGADVNHVDVNGEDALYYLIVYNELDLEDKQDLLTTLLLGGAKTGSEPFNKLKQYLNENNLNEQFDAMLKKSRQDIKDANWKRASSYALLNEGTLKQRNHYLSQPFVNREIASFIKPELTGGKRKTKRKIKKNNKSNNRRKKTKKTKKTIRKQ